MATALDISSLFQVNYMALKANLDGLTQAESIMQPSPAGNNLNWVLGHILANRCIILEMLNEKPIFSEIQCAPYKRGAKPSVNDLLLPWNALLESLEKSQNTMIRAIEKLTPEQLGAMDPDNEHEWRRQPLADQLMFLQFHEAYHIGQTGLLRRMVGVDGAIQ